MSEFNIEEELKKLPGSPGVYIMHDAKDTIIYVGKAVSLKNRVRSYFRAGVPHTAKINKMISLIHRNGFRARSTGSGKQFNQGKLAEVQYAS